MNIYALVIFIVGLSLSLLAHAEDDGLNERLKNVETRVMSDNAIGSLIQEDKMEMIQSVSSLLDAAQMPVQEELGAAKILSSAAEQLLEMLEE